MVPNQRTTTDSAFNRLVTHFFTRLPWVTAEPDAAATQPTTAAATIEIDLAGKYRVLVSSGVDAQALRRVLDVLELR